MKQNLLLVSILYLLSSCSEPQVDKIENNAFGLQTDSRKEEQNITSNENVSNYQIINDLRFEVNGCSAVDFLNKTGRKVDPADLDELNNESVISLTISDTSIHKKITEHKRFTLSDEELNSYLELEILKDFTVIQKDDTLFPTGVQSESRGIMIQNKISVLLFFNNIDMSKDFKVQYNDRLFGAGLMRINTIKRTSL